jgi:hypothetical protein
MTGVSFFFFINFAWTFTYTLVDSYSHHIKGRKLCKDTSLDLLDCAKFDNCHTNSFRVYTDFSIKDFPF